MPIQESEYSLEFLNSVEIGLGSMVAQLGQRCALPVNICAIGKGEPQSNQLFALPLVLEQYTEPGDGLRAKVTNQVDGVGVIPKHIPIARAIAELLQYFPATSFALDGHATTRLLEENPQLTLYPVEDKHFLLSGLYETPLDIYLDFETPGLPVGDAA